MTAERERLLSVAGLSFAYQPERLLLDNISFELSGGQLLVLAGLSGSGKTTLAHILTGIIPACIAGEPSGSVRVCGEDIAGKKPAQLAERIALVFQDSDAQLIAATVEGELAFGLENLCVAPAEIRERVDRQLAGLGFTGLAERHPDSLSGGQKKLLALGAVLILEPRVIIFDEPFAHLDEQGRELVKRALMALREQGRGLLLIEHDLSLVDYADSWLILHEGRIVAEDSPAALLEQRERLRAWQLWYDEDDGGELR
ncbi:MAG: ABC transporter ATP-binding protein [Bacillota bacterium]|nr:ABC transporter ATP-binding protein [Bacillota bacterium]